MQIVSAPEPTRKPNPYADDVAKLSAATDANSTVAGAFVVPNDDVSRARTLIGKAANALDRTAAVVGTVEGKTETTLTFRIKPRHKTGPRARKGGTVDTGADAV